MTARKARPVRPVHPTDRPGGLHDRPRRLDERAIGLVAQATGSGLPRLRPVSRFRFCFLSQATLRCLLRMSSRSLSSPGRLSGSGGASAAAAGIGSLLPAALHGPQEHSYTGTQDHEVAEHLDDEHYPGCLGFGGDVPETHR